MRTSAVKIILWDIMGKSFSLSEPQVSYLLNGHNNTSLDKWDNGSENTCKLFKYYSFYPVSPRNPFVTSIPLHHPPSSKVDWKLTSTWFSLLSPKPHQPSPLSDHVHNWKSLLSKLPASNLAWLDCSLLTAEEIILLNCTSLISLLQNLLMIFHCLQNKVQTSN